MNADQTGSSSINSLKHEANHLFYCVDIFDSEYFIGINQFKKYENFCFVKFESKSVWIEINLSIEKKITSKVELSSIQCYQAHKIGSYFEVPNIVRFGDTPMQ